MSPSPRSHLRSPPKFRQRARSAKILALRQPRPQAMVRHLPITGTSETEWPRMAPPSRTRIPVKAATGLIFALRAWTVSPSSKITPLPSRARHPPPRRSAGPASKRIAPASGLDPNEKLLAVHPKEHEPVDSQGESAENCGLQRGSQDIQSRCP